MKKELEGTEETEVEVSDEIVKAIVAGVKGEVMEAVEKRFESIEATKKDATNKSSIDIEKEKADGYSKQRLFAKQVIALKNGNRSQLKMLNEIALGKMDAETKSAYQSSEDGASGGYLIPTPDFIADVARLDGVYGVSFRDARVITVNSNTVLINKKTGGLTLYETGEGVAKTGTEMTFGQDNIVLRKFAGIAPFTDELDEDGAVSIYDELVTDFALARNKKADELVFTDPTYGITNISGVNITTFGAAFSDISFDDMAAMIGQLSQAARIGAKFYISRSVETQLLSSKVTSTYAWGPAYLGAPGTIWGYPYELVDVLPTDFQTNQAYAVFGNLKFVALAVKAGLVIDILTEGTIHDSGNNAINLAEQDMKAVRAVTRMNARVQFPQAFSVGGTGTVS